MSEQQHQSTRPRRSWARSLVPATVAALTFAGGGIVMASQGTPASATPQGGRTPYRVVADPLPAPGKTWIQGVLTDQASHPLDNVNVEVWSASPGTSAPVASNLTYAGTPADARHQHGVFRVEVPMNQPYVIVLSGVSGSEDGDRYRMRTVGNGRPIMARSAGGTSARAVTGRVLDLGRFQLARQGQVSSTTTARLAKKVVKSGHRAQLNVTVASRYVSAPTGKLVVHVNGTRVTHRLRSTDHGKASIRLPRIRKSGKHRITVVFLATSTIGRSVSEPLRLTVI
jgi:hypothetical protein